MKLYTEEQVKIAYSKGNNDGYCGIQRDFIALNLMPIELPSDKEIEEYGNHPRNNEWAQFGIMVGAKWMREQILGKEDKTFKQKSKWTKL
jgi:hypothetical protein